MSFRLLLLGMAILGSCLLNTGCEKEDPDVKIIRTRAEHGDTKAQIELGDRYEHRRGVPYDPEKAATWFRKAAEKGDAEGQAKLGDYLYCGIGMPRDYTEAVKWLRKGAEQENAAAQDVLAYCYLDGRGVPKDLVSAHCFFNLAYLNGYPYAADSRNNIERQLTPDQITASEAMTRQWLEGHPKK